MGLSRIELIALGLMALPIIDVITTLTTKFTLYEHISNEYFTLPGLAVTMFGSILVTSALALLVLYNVSQPHVDKYVDKFTYPDHRLQVFEEYLETLDFSFMDKEKEY